METQLQQTILDFIDENDGVFTWTEAVKLVSHLLQTSESNAEYHLGRMLAGNQLKVRRGKLETV